MELPLTWQILSAGFGGYVIVSLVALRFPLPHMRHKPRCSSLPRRIHSSHRGGAFERCENTMAAFRHAVQNCHTDHLETDVWLSADQKVVVSHDNSLERVAGRDIKITETGSSELPRLLPLTELRRKSRFYSGLQSQIDAHETKEDNQINGKAEPMATLEELFKEFPETVIQMDIKQHNENSELLTKRIRELVRKYDREELTIWGSMNSRVHQLCVTTAPEMPRFFSARQGFFDQSHLIHSRKTIAMRVFTAPEMSRFFSARQVVTVVLSYFFGLLPFLPLHKYGQFFECMYPSREVLAFLRTHYGDTWRTRILTSFSTYVLTRRWLFEHLQARGVRVILWTINNEGDMRFAFEELGVDGVMTDRPSLLKKTMRSLDASTGQDQRTGS